MWLLQWIVPWKRAANQWEEWGKSMLHRSFSRFCRLNYWPVNTKRRVSVAYRLNCLCSFEKNREKFSALRTNTPIYNLGQDSVILSSRTPEEHNFVLKMVNWQMTWTEGKLWSRKLLILFWSTCTIEKRLKCQMGRLIGRSPSLTGPP